MLKQINRRLWDVKLSERNFILRKTIGFFRILELGVQSFLENKCMLRASALTFYTLLSIIPVAALAFAIAKGFGFEEILEKWLLSTLSDYKEVADKIILFSRSMLSTAKGGVIAGAGALALMFTTIRLLMQIEHSFNDIWGVKHGRSILRKLSDYLSLVLLCPMVIIVSGSALVFATTQINGIAKLLPFIGSSADHLVMLSTRMFPFFATWFIFSFIYLFVPNTKVKFMAALTGGFAAGILYYLVQTLYIAAQFMVGKYSAIYGGFAALPLFLIWLQMSWTIVLFGAEMSFSYQNAAFYEGSAEAAEAGFMSRAVYALKIARLCAIHFESGLAPLTDTVISRQLEIPIRITRQTLFELGEAGIVSKVISVNGTEAYQSAIPPIRITPLKVLNSLQLRGGTPPENDAAYQLLLKILQDAANSKFNEPLHKLDFK